MSGNNSLSVSEIEAIRTLLSRTGDGLDPLAAGMESRSDAVGPVPTFNEFIPRVARAVEDGTVRVYEPYWRRLCQEWGTRSLTEPSVLEIQELAKKVRAEAVVRRNSRGGRGAAENLIAALRCVYRYAEAEGLVERTANPARRARKPRRLPSTRRALRAAELYEINTAAATSGNDPELDTLLIRLHTETACRRGGALALRPMDLDRHQCLIRLREKGQTERWQPVSPTLMHHLLLHAADRGCERVDDQLLRYRNGRPVTKRRYDYLWQRLGQMVPWVAAQQVSMHWLRHTTLTWVERAFGYGVARAFAGHNGRNDVGSTATYVRADLYEVVRALAALTGEPHPLQERLDASSMPDATGATVSARAGTPGPAPVSSSAVPESGRQARRWWGGQPGARPTDDGLPHAV